MSLLKDSISDLGMQAAITFSSSAFFEGTGGIVTQVAGPAVFPWIVVALASYVRFDY